MCIGQAPGWSVSIWAGLLARKGGRTFDFNVYYWAVANGDGGSGGRRVLVVGVGDDGPAGLPTSVLGRIEQAELLVGGRRHLDLFAGGAAERLAIAGGLDDVISKI